jgi:hypothetical protein
MSPDGPLFASRVDKDIEPDVPDDVVPVANVRVPEEPAAPELVEETTMAPEDVWVPKPVVSDTDPPEAVVEVPASAVKVPCPSTLPLPIDSIAEPLLPP